MRQKNAIRRRVEAGEPVFGIRSKTLSPVTVEVFGEVGFDFVWVDLEHFGPSAADSHAIEHLARAAERVETELLVRIPEPDPSVIRKVLDTGVRTVLVSRVETKAQTRRAVRASRFTYDGKAGARGSASCRAKSWGLADSDYHRGEDDTTLVGVMVETTRGVENSGDIASVPDLGFIFLGPADLAISLGHPGDRDAPAVQEGLDRVRTAAADEGVPVGQVASSVKEVKSALDTGATVVRAADEVGDLVPVLRKRLDAVQ